MSDEKNGNSSVVQGKGFYDLPPELYEVIFCYLNLTDFVHWILINRAIHQKTYTKEILEIFFKKCFEQYFPEDYKRYTMPNARNNNNNNSSNSSNNSIVAVNWGEELFIKCERNLQKFGKRDREIFYSLKESNTKALNELGFKFTDLNDEMLDWVMKHGSQKIKDYLFNSLENDLTPKPGLKVEALRLNNYKSIFLASFMRLVKFGGTVLSLIHFCGALIHNQISLKKLSNSDAANEIMLFYAIFLNQPMGKINELKQKVSDELGKNLLLPLVVVTKHHAFHTLLEQHFLAHKNDDHSGLLCVAALSGNIQAVKLCIQNKVNINTVTVYGTNKTALHYAGLSGNAETVKYLIENGANIDALDRQSGTPLHDAAFAGNAEIVELILKNKQNIDELDDTQKTPLHHAAFAGNVETAKFLVENGANIGAVDEDGKTPFYYAVQNANVEAAKYLAEKEKPHLRIEGGELRRASAREPKTLECLWNAYQITNNGQLPPNFNPAAVFLTDKKAERFNTGSLEINREDGLFDRIATADINKRITFIKNEKNEILSPFYANFHGLIAIEVAIKILEEREEPEKAGVLKKLREHTLKNMNKPLNVYECLTQSDIEVLNKPRPGLLNTAMNFFSKSNTSSQNKTDAMIFIENLALFIKEYTSSHVFTEPSVTANSRVKNEEKEKINPISENAEVKSAEASNVDTKKTQDPDANSENNQAPTPG